MVLDCLHLHRVLAINEYYVLPLPFTGTTHPAMHPRVYGPMDYGHIYLSPVSSCSANDAYYDRGAPLTL